MRRLTYMALCLCGLFCGCCATRQNVKSDAVEIREAETATTSGTEDDRTEQLQTVSGQECDEEVITVTTVYDTSQPANPATGTYPVREQISQRRRISTRIRQQTSAESRQTQVRTEQQETTEKSQTATVAKMTTRRGMNGTQCILHTIGLLAAAGITGWLLWQRFKR